jgi:zinc protease
MRWLALAVLLVAAPSRAGGVLHVPVEKYTLPNGLTVILHEDHRVPQVVVDLWFRVGSKDEAPRRTGFAHLFEHLMFMGTKNVPNGQFDAIMEAEGGANNASTSEDHTNYFEVGPSHLLETFLWLEADRLSSLPDAMTRAKLDLQRDVVKNERRQTYENRPYGGVELALPEALFPPAHPYHHPVIGSHSDLSAAQVGDVKAFFRKFYVPSNASLVIAGDFAAADARRLIERYFGWMARVPEPAHARPAPARLDAARRVTLTDAVELPQVTAAWLTPGLGEPGDAECELLAAVLGAGDSSRLARALVFDRRLAQSVEVEQRQQRYASELVVTAIARPNVDPAALERAIDDELARALREPPTEREVARAQAFVETRHLEEIDSLFGLADKLNEVQFRYGDPGELERALVERYRSATVGDVAKWTRAMLARPRVTVTVTPREAKK